MSSPFQPAAQRAGLALVPPDAGYLSAFGMSGVVAGHLVRVTRDPMIRIVRTDVYFPVPFDLGLRVAPAGQLGFGSSPPLIRNVGRVLGKIFGTHDMRIGDQQVDDLFTIHGDEEARVAPLLEAARDALLAWHKSGVPFDLDDAHVSVRRYFSVAWGDDPNGVCDDVPAALSLAQRLEAARASLPAATPLLPHVGVLRAFATDHGMAFSATPLAASGSVGPFGFLAHAARLAPDSFELDVSLRWDVGERTLGGNVRSRPAKSGAPVADATFEESFTITGDGLEGRLSSEARAALLNLRRAEHDIVVDDQGLHLRHTLGAEPYAFGPVADEAAATLLALDTALVHR
jgi:hypothetical protein